MADERKILQGRIKKLLSKGSWTEEDFNSFNDLISIYPRDTPQDDLVLALFEEGAYLIWGESER